MAQPAVDPSSAPSPSGRRVRGAPGPQAAPTAADQFMHRLLRIRTDLGPAGYRRAQRAFSTSIGVSAVRCLLTYIVLPFVAPAFGLATGVAPVLGLIIGTVAIVANVLTIRRFWAANHTWRWAFTAISGSVIVLLVVLVGVDLARLFG